MKELEEFYKDNDIKYFCDGIGNETWAYEGIVLASYIDMPNEVTHVYCYWAIDKHSALECERGQINPVLKTNKMYFWPANDRKQFKKWFFRHNPWADFENPYKDIEKFKEKLLISVNLLKGRLQVLKGKRTMYNKHKNSKFSNAECINDWHIDWDKIFGKGRIDANVKLKNGNVLPCHKLENGLIYVVDEMNVFLKKSLSNFIILPKTDFIKIAEKEFFLE